MTRYHHITSLEDEEKLLSEIIQLETQIRKEKEEKRVQKNTQNDLYSGIFEPITESIQSLTHHRVEKPKEDLITGDLVQFKTESDQLKDEPVKSDTEQIKKRYKKTLTIIPKRMRDDGVFGLDSGRRLVSGRPYWVEGNLLLVHNEDGTQSEIQINDLEVWLILLSQIPAKIVDLTNEKGISALARYREIVDKLGLIPRVQFTNRNYKMRAKYKLLRPQHEGTGFMFSTRKPSFMSEPIVIPSDQEGLIRALLQAVAELRAGNESIRNLVVPLAQEAERKKILPKGLLSPEELTWVYA